VVKLNALLDWMSGTPVLWRELPTDGAADEALNRRGETPGREQQE
jgi:hypothetical protein